MRRMLQHDLDWYEAHFESEDGLGPRPVRGEISPIYGRMKAWQVRRIANLLPDLRIILTLRHPIERVWSQALLEFGYLKGRDVREVSSIAFLRQVKMAIIALRRRQSDVSALPAGKTAEQRLY